MMIKIVIAAVVINSLKLIDGFGSWTEFADRDDQKMLPNILKLNKQQILDFIQ